MNLPQRLPLVASCGWFLLVNGIAIDYCNLTVYGERYSTGYFGPTLLRSPPVSYSELGSPLLCRYTFEGLPHKQRIVLNVRLLSVGEYDPNRRRCTDGYLRMWDGLADQLGCSPNTLCGSYAMDEIDAAMFTSGHEAEVEFRARAVRPTTSFALSYTFVNLGLESPTHSSLTHTYMEPFKVVGSHCSWRMNIRDCGGTCWVFSPGYPGIYPPNVKCRYNVVSDDPETMLHLTFVDTGLLRSCQDDYILISDGINSSASFIGRFCGRHLPSVTTSGRELWITFVGGGGLPMHHFMKFRASVVAITKEWNPSGHRQPGRRCDWLFRGSSGSVSSPDHWLPAGSECRYIFDNTSEGYLEFIVNVYGLRGDCDDEISIYNGSSLVATLCSVDVGVRQTHFFYVDGHRSSLLYRTANGQLESEPDRGFWLSFRHVDVIPTHADLQLFYSASSSSSMSPMTTVARLICSFMVLAVHNRHMAILFNNT